MSGEEDEQPSRSERLRDRRSQRSKPDESSEPSETDETSELSKTSGISETEAVKDERTGVYMYLTAEQKKQIERLYNVLKADYEFEFEEGFEKNRDFYTLLVQEGLDSLDGLDVQEVKERLSD